MARKFIFIDESGDPGFPGNSSIFAINILITDTEGLQKIESIIANYRFFMGHEKELKKYTFSKNRNLHAVLQKISLLKNTQFFCFAAEKQKYIKKYKNIPLIFRNFVLKKSLEHLFSLPEYKNSNDIFELIIDRYLDKESERENLRTYLWGAFKLPQFLDISQIDSRCSNGLQILDVLGYFFRKNSEVKNFTFSSFV